MIAPDHEEDGVFGDLHDFTPEKKIVMVLVVKPSGLYMVAFPLIHSDDGKLLIGLESLSTHDGQVPFLTVEASESELRPPQNRAATDWDFFYEKCFKMTEDGEFIRVIEYGSNE
jgi:hypothetical protein